MTVTCCIEVYCIYCVCWVYCVCRYRLNPTDPMNPIDSKDPMDPFTLLRLPIPPPPDSRTLHGYSVWWYRRAWWSSRRQTGRDTAGTVQALADPTRRRCTEDSGCNCKRPCPGATASAGYRLRDIPDRPG